MYSDQVLVLADLAAARCWAPLVSVTLIFHEHGTRHGTARAPAQRPTSEAEIKIDETRVDRAAAVRLLYQWSGWPGPSSMLAVLLQLNQNFVVLTLIPSESELWRTEHQAPSVKGVTARRLGSQSTV